MGIGDCPKAQRRRVRAGRHRGFRASVARRTDAALDGPVSTAAHETVGREDWIAGCVRLRLTGVQPRYSGGVEERDRLPLRGMESQSRGIRELRSRGRCEGCRAAAARPGRGARRDGACASVALDDERLRTLHDVQALVPSREVRGNRAGPGGHLGRSAEAAPMREKNMTVSKRGAKRIRVGIIGTNPDRGWAAQAHIPALKSLSDDFEITALSTSRRESADAAGKLFGVSLAFDNHRDLVNSGDVDVVAVIVKSAYHRALATAALNAGKAVYCEWPLGNGLNEAETLAALAKKKGVLAAAGLQARSAPPVAYVHDLIGQGYVGELLSTTLIGSGMGWGPTVEPFNAYLNDKKNGATMLSIALGHAADALCQCLGEVRELSATMAVRRKSFKIAGTGESKPMTADDQVAVTGLLEGGAAFSIHYRGGVSRGTNMLWEINGTEGDLQLTATGGQAQIWELDVRGGKDAQSSLDVMPVPEKYWWAPPQGPGTNVAQAYARFARDYREGTHLCPTFEDAVTRQRMLNAIETAATTGQRQAHLKREVEPGRTRVC